MDSFKAWRVHAVEVDGKKSTEARYDDISLADLEADSTEGNEVIIKAAWSDVNYKDALAISGAGRIMRKSPCVAGIDVSGTVVSSADSRFQEGDEVLVTGCQLGEALDGGYSEYVKVAGPSVIALPEGLSLRDAMALGTAGFTAALAVHRMQQNAQTPELGPIAVTGPTGGVGGLAVQMLSKIGFEVHAITGKPSEADYLKSLGASAIVDRNELELGSRPLEKVMWGGAVDNLGGDLLSWLTRTTTDGGNVASIGLAASHKLETTVMPFILRGVNLLGINSVVTPLPVRNRIWERLASDLKPELLDQMVTREVELAEVDQVMADYVKGAVTGRTLVKIS